MKITLRDLMLSNSLVYIVDFEDSFTFNIASEVYKYEKKIEVINHVEFFSNEVFEPILKGKDVKIAVILGPGPGHPGTYHAYFEKIQRIKKSPHIFLMGICLGHQIISVVDGLKVRQSNKPMHGNQMKIDFNNRNILVQRYNSLSVFSSDTSTDELMVRNWERGISYQFHPESIGTHNNRIFFSDMLDFLVTVSAR